MSPELINADELSSVLEPALLKAVEQLAPVGSNRSVPINIFCDCLTELIADLLVEAPTTTRVEAEIERLTTVFRAKLLASMGLGHA